jgi:hypothetical protein
MPLSFSEVDSNDFPVLADLPQVTAVNSHGPVVVTDLAGNDTLRGGLIRCENCSKTFNKRMHYKYGTISSRRRYCVLMFLAVIAKPTIDHITVRSVPKLLRYEAMWVVI